ncbi:hypothetical protein Hanom_Chr12g01177101 [Helianthus anomalus]
MHGSCVSVFLVVEGFGLESKKNITLVEAAWPLGNSAIEAVKAVKAL